MSNKSLNVVSPPPTFRAAISSSRPPDATSYRLKNLEGDEYFPSLEQPAALCSPRQLQGIPNLVAGTYEILYYRDPADAESLIPTAKDRDPPTLQISQDAVLITPADYEIRELRRWQQYEQRELSQRRQNAGVKQIEALTSNAIERDAAMTQTFVKLGELQAQMMTLHQTLIGNIEKQTEAHNQSLLSIAETSREAIGKIKTDNVYSVVSEAIKQLGTVLHAKVASDGEPTRERRLRGQVTARPALEGRRGGEPSEGKRRNQDDPPSLPPAAPPSSPAASAGASAKPLPVVEIDWLDVCDRQLDPQVEPAALPAAAPAVPAPFSEREESAPACPPLTAVPDEINALVAQVPELEALLASLGIVTSEVIVKPADWSYRWAWQAIKRRIARLSDSSIAWLLSSVDNALGFLRELADLATPPPNLDEAEGAS
jgi:hypothetical protein